MEESNVINEEGQLNVNEEVPVTAVGTPSEEGQVTNTNIATSESPITSTNLGTGISEGELEETTATEETPPIMTIENLEYILYGIIALLVIVATVIILLMAKNRKKKKEVAASAATQTQRNSKKNNTQNVKSVTEFKGKKLEPAVKTELEKPEEYQPQKQVAKSDMKDINTDFVENFMEFDEISDNMIVQNSGDKYIMVIKCQGINYDLMSANEMVAVEEGFIQFLNTLRFPIQLYVQTSSLDLSDSIKEYNARIDVTGDELEQLQIKLKRLEEFDEDNIEQIEALRYEIRKKRNIYEYGKDIIQNVERISKNKSILQQNYYVVVPYYVKELGTNNFKPEELKEMAFSELYTRCKGLIGSLKVCNVEGKILNSFELAELLHLAYNRDEGEIFSFKNALEAQYDRLYHTAPDVLEKKIALMEEKILEQAARNANEEIIKASGLVPGDLDENNETIQRLIYENQKQAIKEYNGLIDSDVLQEAVNNTTEQYKEKRKKIKKHEEEEKRKKQEERKKLEEKKSKAKALEVAEDDDEEIEEENIEEIEENETEEISLDSFKAEPEIENVENEAEETIEIEEKEEPVKVEKKKTTTRKKKGGND